MTTSFDWEDLFRREQEIRDSIACWQRIPANNASDLAEKEDRLTEYELQLEAIKLEYSEQIELAISQLPGRRDLDAVGDSDKSENPNNSFGSKSANLPNSINTDNISKEILTSLHDDKPESTTPCSLHKLLDGLEINHRPRMRVQEDIILHILCKLGHNPGALPPWEGGPWVKKDARNLLQDQKIGQLFFTKKVFDLAWERLKKDGRISALPKQGASTIPTK
ncbi:hypothetical protein E4634_14005 [Mangrovimicrobium sediminis]|uniref:Uncharacterized protein n=1 Tax=Mangrovimicrobium sediminis TaxID=2562682 RepID=A0A4Z0LZ29_9GAMM|nr:hypothetical protein [Haliea sp. SAOS-164]TGD72633.1 hypothetical protein E4634_14005 [Haliea sp. SAOS-164]